MTKRRNRAVAVAGLALCLAGAGFGRIEPLQGLPKTAHRVYCYYTALQRNAQPMSWWDRVTYSLILAGSEGKAAKRAINRT
jgi:hypothetical protein